MTNRLAFDQFCSAVRRKGALALCLGLCVLGPGLSATADDHKATIITFEAPGAGTGAYQGTYGFGLNDLGAITGIYVDSVWAVHGFLRDPFGNFTEFDAPDADPFCGTYPVNPNNAGEIDRKSVV